MKTGHKNMTVQKDYDLTPWNYQTREEQTNRTHNKKTVTTAPSFFKRRNYSEVDRTFEKVQSQHKFKERDMRQTMKYQNQQPLFAKTFNVTFQSQSHLRTLTTDRLKKEFQNFAKQLTSRSAAKQTMLRVKTVSKSNTAKQLRTQFLNFTQRKSQACEPQRIPLKRETIVRSHNNFFQSTINRNKSRNRSKDGKISQLLRCIRKNVIRDSNLKHLIKNTQSTFLTQKT